YDSKNQSWEDPAVFNYIYARAVLGLAETFEFLTVSGKHRYQVKVKSGEGVERFRSPVLIKYIGGEVFFLANTINKEILEKRFIFDLNLKISNAISVNSVHKTENLIGDFLETPKEFNIGAFFDFVSDKSSEKIENLVK